jgi:hypothetical protein
VGTRARDKSSWRWAWAALALIAFAGVAAALSRQLGSQADARQPGELTLGATRDAGSESESEDRLRSRAAQRRASTTTLPPSLPTLPAPPAPRAPAESARPFEMAPPVEQQQPQTAEPGSSELPRGRPSPRAKTRSDKPIVAPAGGRDGVDISNFGGRR